MADRDLIEALRRADPVAYVRDEVKLDAPPPRDVLARIVAAPPARRRPPRRAAVGVLAVAAVAAIALVVALPPGRGPSLAARAYAATAPGDYVYYTETTTATRATSLDGSKPREGSFVLAKLWQYRDRMHDTMDAVDIDSVTGRPLVDTPGHRHHWFYEHDQNGPVFRTLLDGKVDSIRVDDPGWRGDEGRQGFKLNVTTIVDSYRHEFATNRLRDAGETTFAGRSARAYDVVGEPGGQTQTYYIDAETALPLGKVMTVDTYPPRLDAAHKPSAKLTITEIVKRFERLAPTPENVAKLDAPAIDAHR